MKATLLILLSLLSFSTLACSEMQRQNFELVLKVGGGYVPTGGSSISVCATTPDISKQLGIFFTLFNVSDAQAIAERFTSDSNTKEIASFIAPFEVAFTQNKKYTLEDSFLNGNYIYAIFSVEGKYRNYMRFVKAENGQIFLKEHEIQRDQVGVLLVESTINKIKKIHGSLEYSLGDMNPIQLHFDLINCLATCSNQYIKYIQKQAELIKEGKFSDYFSDLTAKSSNKINEWLAPIPAEERSNAILYYLIPRNITYVVDLGSVVIVGWLLENDYEKVKSAFDQKTPISDLPQIAMRHHYFIKESDGNLKVTNVYYESIVDDMFKDNLIFLKKIFE